MAGEIKILQFVEGVDVGPPVELTSVVKIVTADYTMLDEDDYIEIDATANTVDVTLTNPTTCEGKELSVKCVNKTFTARVLSAQLIDGAANYTYTDQYESIGLISNGTTWRII